MATWADRRERARGSLCRVERLGRGGGGGGGGKRAGVEGHQVR